MEHTEEETLKTVKFSKSWVVVLTNKGADIQEGLLGRVIITSTFDKKEILDLICRCFNAHDRLVKHKKDLLAALRPFADFACDDWQSHKCYNCLAKQAIAKAE